jgi:hypothetical protein
LAGVAFAGPIEVVIAILVFAVLLRWPRAQPWGVIIGVLGGLLVMATTH